MKPPILVFGLPRSGTTWIGKLFDSHPDTLYRHEPDSVRRLELPLYPEIERAGEYAAQIRRLAAALPRMRSPEVVGKLPLFPKNYQSAAGLGAYRASVLAAKAAGHIWRRAPCVYRPTAGNGRNARAVWKSIESSGRLGAIMHALPHARAIYLLRHPCGRMASVRRGNTAQRFTGGKTHTPWLLKLLLQTRIGQRMAPSLEELKELTREERMAWFWVLAQENIRADIGGNERVLTVRYEDVCAQPLAMTQRMFEFAGLDWHPQTQMFVRASTQVSENVADTGYYSVFKPPQASAERWRTELDAESIERVMQVVRQSSLYRFYGDEPEDAALAAGAAS
jgi:hypothetical protein